MTTPMLPDPKYQAWVQQGIRKLRSSGFTDQEIRDNWLIGEQGMADSTADQFLPRAVPQPTPPQPAAPAIPGDLGTALAPGGVGELMKILGLYGPDALKNAGGVASSALRGVSLGASDYIKPLREASAAYRQDRPVTELGIEMVSGGLLNPFKWIRGFNGLAGKVGQFMAPEAAPAKSGIVAAAKRIGGGTARGAAYGGTYGFNTTQGDLGERAVGGLGGTIVGGGLGAGLGTVFSVPEVLGGAKASRAAIGLSPKSRDFITKAQNEQGGLRDPSTLQPGEMLIDNAGPLEKSLVQEAVRRSPEGLVLAERMKTDWIRGQKDAPLGLALEIAGVPEQESRRFPNPLILARELRARAKADAAPLYERLASENPAIAKTPALEAALEAPDFREFLTSKEFERFAQNRAAADKVSLALGGKARGAVMSSDAVKAALGEGQSAEMVGILRKAQQVLGKPLDPVTAAALQRSATKMAGTAPEAGFDWRTLQYAKLAIDQRLSGEPMGSLDRIGRADLSRIRAGLMDALKQAPGYEEANARFAGGHVEAEMLEAGRKAARQGPNEVEALLTDPKTLALGDAAVNQARYGVLTELHRQLDLAPRSAKQTGQVWTTPRVRMLKLVAATPDQAQTVDAFLDAQGKRWDAFNLVPKRVPGIQTKAQEQAQGALAGIATAGGLGTGLGFRAGNVMQRMLGRMSSADALDIVRTYFSPNPGQAMQAVLGGFPRDASRVGEMSGRLAGWATGQMQQP